MESFVASEKSRQHPAAGDDAERIATVILRLPVENNSEFVRDQNGESIKRYSLEPCGMKPLESGTYAPSIPYRNNGALDKAVYNLLTEISQEAEMRNCFIEADYLEACT
jgi:hypothetical protein